MNEREIAARLHTNGNGHEPKQRLQTAEERANYSPHGDGREIRTPVSELKIVTMNTVQPEAIDYLWKDRLARRKLHLLCGVPGIGKSFVCTVDIPAHITTGKAWPDGAPAAPIGHVLVLAAEDGLSDTLRPRYDAAGADTSKIHVVQVRRNRGEDGEYECQVDLGRDIELIDKLLESRPEISTVVIDPVTEFLGSIDGNSNIEVRAKLTPLVRLAEKRNVALLGVTHFNKGTQGPALYRAMGSVAFVAVSRIAWAFIRDHEDTDRVLVLPLKNNLSRSAPGLAFRIVDGRVEWEEGAVHTSADEALEPPKPGKAPERLGEAVEWLRKELGDSCRESKQLELDAREAGISKATLWRARKELSVAASKGAGDGKWYVRLPDASASRTRVENRDDDDERDEGLDGSQAPQAPHVPHGSQGVAEW
jgi:putative DNA primase/helicase